MISSDIWAQTHSGQRIHITVASQPCSTDRPHPLAYPDTCPSQDNPKGTAMAWEGSDRKAELPHDWPQRRAAVIARDRTCRWPTEHGPCGAHGTDVDHRHSKHDHHLTNLWLLCSYHHNRKTAGQGNTAKTRYSRRRAREQHPGLL